MKKKAFQRFTVVIMCITIVIGFCSCQKSPDSSLVVNKDFDKLIEEAEGTALWSI